MKHRRKTGLFLTAALLALLLMIPAFPARADIIVEPYGSDFYDEHRDECRYEDAVYEINASGGVRLMADPESDTVLYEYGEIGTRVWISVIYTNPKGGSWGYTEYFAEDEGGSRSVEGWLPMGLLWKCYNSDMFRRDNQGKIRNRKNEVPVESDEEEMTVNFWSYPGSESCGAYTDNTVLFENDPIRTSLEYTDDLGRKWGYIGYYYAWEGWICLDAPDASFSELWPDGAPKFDTRDRKYYEIVYNENSTELKEYSDETAAVKASESETAATAAEESSAAEAESTAEETRKETESHIEETTAAPDTVPVRTALRWAIPLALVGVTAVTAAIVLLVLFRKKKI